MIALIDAGSGNLRSVARALVAAGVPEGALRVTRDPAVIVQASRVVFPGQGAFGDCVRALDAEGQALRQALDESLARGVPYLGMCLGMQVLFERSDEAPGAQGLAYLQGDVVRLPEGRVDTRGCAVKIPHMGWNIARTESAHRALIGDDAWYYFVHSYVVRPSDPSVIAARTEHGEDFVSAVARDHVFAVQFHPEKSQRAGQQCLLRWLAV
ncbi:MAG: imidazole glycerol phosphate synthase subunit HisH [Deltaproteobacteria bacterium]|nr:imidazole glycerol phosphate synthase subunit HisH [Deltaproteobacteria bacterium]